MKEIFTPFRGGLVADTEHASQGLGATAEGQTQVADKTDAVIEHEGVSATDIWSTYRKGEDRLIGEGALKSTATSGPLQKPAGNCIEAGMKPAPLSHPRERSPLYSTSVTMQTTSATDICKP